MGSFRIRKSKSFGGVRFTASKRGISASVGKGPLRITRGASGRITQTARIPGTGISYVNTTGGGRRPAASRAAAGRVGVPAMAGIAPISNAEWRELLVPDGEALALTFQRDFVRARVSARTKLRPSLQHLTIGQAVRILERVGESPQPLFKGGRNSPVLNKGGVISRWGLLVLFLIILCFIPALGPVLALVIVALVVVAKVRRGRRQHFEDELPVAKG